MKKNITIKLLMVLAIPIIIGVSGITNTYAECYISPDMHQEKDEYAVYRMVPQTFTRPAISDVQWSMHLYPHSSGWNQDDISLFCNTYACGRDVSDVDVGYTAQCSTGEPFEVQIAGTAATNGSALLEIYKMDWSSPSSASSNSHPGLWVLICSTVLALLH